MKQNKNKNHSGFVYLAGSRECSLATAFILAFLSLLLQHSISAFENFVSKEQNHCDPSVANGASSTVVENGVNLHKMSTHETFSAVGGKTRGNGTRKPKQVVKHRRRRRRRRNIEDSFESYSGSGSDDGSEECEDEDSDLSEGGVVDGLLDDLMSDDDSEDVYIESDSDNETGHHAKGVQKFPNSTEQFPNHHTTAEPKIKGGFLGQNGLSVGRTIRPDLVSDVSDAETGKTALNL